MRSRAAFRLGGRDRHRRAEGRLAFENLTLCRSDADVPLLKDLSVDIVAIGRRVLNDSCYEVIWRGGGYLMVGAAP